jgi:hypothetical protein
VRWWQIIQSGLCSESDCRKTDTHNPSGGVGGLLQ